MVRKKTLRAAAAAGDRKAELQALRTLLAESITQARKDGSLRDISPLAGKLLEVGRELTELEEAEGVEVPPDEPFDPETI